MLALAAWEEVGAIPGDRIEHGADAPFGSPDPRVAVAAAIDRRTERGQVLGPVERVPAAAALELFLAPLARPGGPARRVAAGAPADLCVLGVPLAEALAAPSSRHVAATIARGQVTYGA